MSYVLVTGGAGFIGANLVDRLCRNGESVVILDNLSRAGVERNLEWLLRHHTPRLRCIIGDVRDLEAVREAVSGANRVFHLAAQMESSMGSVDPIEDFEVNARGTLNILEAIRNRPGEKPAMIHASTARIMAGLEKTVLAEEAFRYAPIDTRIRTYGIAEDQGIEFCSLHTSSKGAADQYVLNYAHHFGIPATVFRLGSVYGPHQVGLEDQCWIGGILRAVLTTDALTIPGDGKQVRDLLHVDDLLDAFQAGMRSIRRLSGGAFNVGGGPRNAASVLELAQKTGSLLEGRNLELRHGPWRSIEPRYLVLNISRFRDATGWTPRTGLEEGFVRQFRWMQNDLKLIEEAA